MSKPMDPTTIRARKRIIEKVFGKLTSLGFNRVESDQYVADYVKCSTHSCRSWRTGANIPTGDRFDALTALANELREEKPDVDSIASLRKTKAPKHTPFKLSAEFELTQKETEAVARHYFDSLSVPGLTGLIADIATKISEKKMEGKASK